MMTLTPAIITDIALFVRCRNRRSAILLNAIGIFARSRACRRRSPSELAYRRNRHERHRAACVGEARRYSPCARLTVTRAKAPAEGEAASHQRGAASHQAQNYQSVSINRRYNHHPSTSSHLIFASVCG